MANITEDGNFKTKLYSPVFMELPFGIVEFFSALNIFLSITASLGNALILIALHNVSIYPPTKLFFRCLAVTDLCVGLIVQPLYATFLLYHLTEENENFAYYVSEIYNVLSWILCGISLFTSTAISVDRLLALVLGLRYRHVVTLKRTYVIIITFWIVSAALSAMKCCSVLITIWYSIIGTLVCLVTSIFSYTKVFFTLRHRQYQVPKQQISQPFHMYLNM